jgi:catalase
VHHDEYYDFVQAGMLYRGMPEDARERMVANIAGNLGRVSRPEIIERSIGHFRDADPEYGARVEAAVKAQRG